MRFIRLIKGLMLLLWIFTLLSLAVYAGSGKASIAQLLNLFPSLSSSWEKKVEKDLTDEKKPSSDNSDKKKTEEQDNPHLALKNFLLSRDTADPAPIESVLDGIFVKINWENIGKTYKLSNADYNDIFTNIENEIKSISDNISIEGEYSTVFVDKILNIFTKLPQPTKPSETNPPESEDSSSRSLRFQKIVGLRGEIQEYITSTSIAIPNEVKAWIKRDRSMGDSRRDRDKLLNTFLLLIVIGTFGSVIFLVRDFIDIETEAKTTLSSYLLKPILGMFLAIAVFILDILAHAAVSSGSILAVRHETLYVLALSAGLLSEQTYAVVSSKAQIALKNLQESE